MYSKKYITPKYDSWMCPLFIFFNVFFKSFFSPSARVTPPERTSELASRRGRPSNTYRRRSLHCDVDAVCHGNPTDGGGASSIIGRFVSFFTPSACHAAHTQNTHHSHRYSIHHGWTLSQLQRSEINYQKQS